jgi:alpha-mannosidase
VEAVEVDGQERQIGPATIEKGTLVVRHTPHSPRSFAVRLASPGVAASRATQTPLTLAFNADVVSRDGARGDGAMDAEGRTLPAEELPASLTHAGITFTMGPSGGGEKNALACAGQTIEIPPGSGALHLLAASSEDIEASVVLGGVLGGAAGGVPIPVQFRSWTGFIGQWDNRVFDTEFAEVDFTCKGRVTGITPGFIHREPVAWFATHRHHPTRGNEAYRFSYLFHHVIEVPQGATRITLPGDARIKVMAITASSGGARVAAAAPLYDDFTGRAPVRFRYEYPPPPEPVFTGTRASGAVSVERAATFEALKVGVPREDDGAAGSRGVVFRAFVDGDKYRPHRRSGMKDGTLPRLNDGDFARSSDDTTRCVWYDTEGRFFADLGAVKSISRVVTYSSHVANRAPQYFSLWGATPSAAGVMPSAAITRENHEGWTLLGVVDSRGLGQGGVHASVVAGDGKPLGPARYLLWIAEDMGEGTFFTEIDVDVAP